jgi:hypothetical protein
MLVALFICPQSEQRTMSEGKDIAGLPIAPSFPIAAYFKNVYASWGTFSSSTAKFK